MTRSRRKKVFEKMEGCVKQANDDGFDYVWIDTCWQVESLVSLMPSSNIASTWIKASSAELSEAINTMYQWYKDSGACYVFLPDAPTKWDVISRSDNTFDPKGFFEERRQGLKICPTVYWGFSASICPLIYGEGRRHSFASSRRF